MKQFSETLVTASEEWVAAGVITPEQRSKLLSRHPIEQRSGGRFMAIMATIGGLLVTAGIALLIASHWQEIGDWTKLGLFSLLLLSAHMLGWRLRIEPANHPRVGDAAFMVGCVLFLLGIALVSQIYHLNSRPANGVLLWWLGILPLPWLLRAKSTQFVSIAAFLIWFGMEVSAEDSWLRLVQRSHRYDGEEFIGVAFILLGAALFFSGIALRRHRHAEFAGLHEKLGLLVANGALYGLSFAWSRRSAGTSYNADVRWLPFMVLLFLLAAVAAWAWRRNRTETVAIAPWILPGLIAAAAFLIGPSANGERWFWGAAACVALLVLNIGMIRVGLANGHESWINFGIGFVALNIFTRYVDLFGTMLQGGVFFVVTGAMVLGLGFYLERKRRSLVGAMRRETL